MKTFFFDLDEAWNEILYLLNALKEMNFQFTYNGVIHTINYYDFLCVAFILFTLCDVLLAFHKAEDDYADDPYYTY